MTTLESVALTASIFGLAFSIIFAIWSMVATRTVTMQTANRQHQMVTQVKTPIPGYMTFSLIAFSLLCITISLVARAINTGHGPFSSMYEFAVAFSWGVLLMGLLFWWRYKLTVIATIGVLVALGLLLFARSLSSQAAPLVPALQQSLLLTTHVASAVISYGAFTIGFGAAVLLLIRWNSGYETDILDKISYRSVMIGFPFMTLVIILGALWADIAWGKYWSWDPKETASLVTWLLYASYLHARVMRGWRGRRAAILLIIGFAAVLITFFGNYVFAGLHSYG